MTTCETSIQKLIRREISSSKSDALQTTSNQCPAFWKSKKIAKKLFLRRKMIQNSIFKKNKKTFENILAIKKFSLEADAM